MPTPLSRQIGQTILLAFVAVPTARAADAPVSFTKDVVPILTQNCVGCHKPGKAKGKLDLSTYAALKAGGEGGPAFVAGDPDKSPLVQQVSGPGPEMPAKGDPLKPEQVATIAAWVRQGAKDDTPVSSGAGAAAPAAVTPGPPPPAQPTAYAMAPVVTAVAFAPDGQTIAIAGRHEILVHKVDGSGLVRRVPSGSPRTTALAFSPDGERLAAAGGAPGVFGQVQLWDASAEFAPVGNVKVSDDTLFGLSFSPSGDRLTVGCADRTVRVLSTGDGAEVLRLDQHTDWALGAVFTTDGARLLSAGRDKGVKLTEVAGGTVVGDINDPKEAVLCLARHPSQDVAAAGGAGGEVRVYRFGAAELVKRTEDKKDPNLVKAIERQPGPANAVAFSPDGGLLAVASTREVRLYATKDWGRKAALAGHAGPVYAVAFSPDNSRVATGGYDGTVRVFETGKGQLVASFVPVTVNSPRAAK